MAMRGAAPFTPVLPIIFVGVVFTLSHDSAFNKSELDGWMDWSRGRVTQGLIRRLAQSSGKKDEKREQAKAAAAAKLGGDRRERIRRTWARASGLKRGGGGCKVTTGFRPRAGETEGKRASLEGAVKSLSRWVCNIC